MTTSSIWVVVIGSCESDGLLPLSCRLLHSCHDDSSRFIYLLAKPGCSYLEQEDLIPLLQVALPSYHLFLIQFLLLIKTCVYCVC